jgi:hypothetical protein
MPIHASYQVVAGVQIHHTPSLHLERRDIKAAGRPLCSSGCYLTDHLLASIQEAGDTTRERGTSGRKRLGTLRSIDTHRPPIQVGPEPHPTAGSLCSASWTLTAYFPIKQASGKDFASETPDFQTKSLEGPRAWKASSFLLRGMESNSRRQVDHESCARRPCIWTCKICSYTKNEGVWMSNQEDAD